MNLLCGRIISARGTAVTLRQFEQFSELSLSSTCPPLLRGDLVVLHVEKNVVQSAEVVHRPTVELRDAVRWSDAAGSDRLRNLRRRQTIIRTLRAYLDAENFLEVASPLLVKGVCPDTYMDSFLFKDDWGLVSSTEYQLKRMLVGGVDRLYSLTQNFRVDSTSQRHNPEFTMLEWARAWESLDEIEADVERFVADAHRAVNGPETQTCSWNGATVQVVGTPWERLALRDALKRYLDISISEHFELDEMLRECDNAEVAIPPSFREDRSYVLSYLIDEMTPKLGLTLPVFIREWPSFMTSSAELVPGHPNLAVRSELFIAGLEVADGFPFLRNAALQRQLFDRELARRDREKRERVPIDHAYLHALEEGIPPGAGMALGVDRLIMILTGAPHIRDVLLFAAEEL